MQMTTQDYVLGSNAPSGRSKSVLNLKGMKNVESFVPTVPASNEEKEAMTQKLEKARTDLFQEYVSAEVDVDEKREEHNRMKNVISAMSIMSALSTAPYGSTKHEPTSEKKPVKYWTNNKQHKKTKMAKASRRRNRK